MPNNSTTYINIGLSAGHKDLLVSVQEIFEDRFGLKIPLSSIARKIIEPAIQEIDWNQVIADPFTIINGNIPKETTDE